MMVQLENIQYTIKQKYRGKLLNEYLSDIM